LLYGGREADAFEDEVDAPASGIVHRGNRVAVLGIDAVGRGEFPGEVELPRLCVDVDDPARTDDEAEDVTRLVCGGGLSFGRHTSSLKQCGMRFPVGPVEATGGGRWTRLLGERHAAIACSII
jgi:hypothetical protein